MGKGHKNHTPIELQTPNRKVQFFFIMGFLLIVGLAALEIIWSDLTSKEQMAAKILTILVLIVIIFLIILYLLIKRKANQSKKS